MTDIPFEFYRGGEITQANMITAMDIRFVRADEAKETPDLLYAEIMWPSGQWQHGKIQITNNHIRQQVQNTVGGMFGPAYVRIFQPNFAKTIGKEKVWIISFRANQILSERKAVMSEQQFKYLTDPCHVDWTRLMNGKETQLPYIY